MKILEGAVKLAQKDFFESVSALAQAKEDWKQGVKKSYVELQRVVTQQYPFILGIGHEQARVYCDGDGRVYEVPRIFFRVDKSVVPKTSPICSEDDEDYERETYLDLFKNDSLLCARTDNDDENDIMADEVLKGLIALDDVDIICDAVFEMVKSEDTELIWRPCHVICCTDGLFSMIPTSWDYG